MTEHRHCDLEISTLHNLCRKIKKERDRVQRGWDQSTETGKKLEIQRNEALAVIEKLRPIVERMADEDCESFCGEVCEEGEDEHCDPDIECWPTRAREAIKVP